MTSREPTPPAPTPRMESLIGYGLLIGVLASASLILAGWIWGRAASGRWGFDYTLPRANFLRFVRQEVREVAQGALSPGSLVKWGIILLFLTPYARVLLSFVYFVCVERNWKYGVLTGVVLSALTYSLMIL